MLLKYKFPWKKVIWMVMAFVISMLVGLLGYSYFMDTSVLDSFFNVSMIMSGMGLSDPVLTMGGKIFVSLFALYSAFFLLAVISVFIGDFMQQFVVSHD